MQNVRSLAPAALMLVFVGAAIAAPANGRGENQPVQGRFIRVESAASKDYLHFAEIEVYVNGKNVAVKKPVKASSTLGSFTPEKAVDGVVRYTWGNDASLWSSAGRGNQWWELDLGAEMPIEKVVLHNRLDCCQERLAGATLAVLDKERRSVGRMTVDDTTVNPLTLVFFEQSMPPVNLAAQSVAQRMAALAPRFTAPSNDTAYVMPVGSGDLSAMLRYGSAYEIHLSKTDFLGANKVCSPLGWQDIDMLSPGHIQLSFGIAPEAITGFEQRIDLNRGSIMLTLKTADGAVSAETYGVMRGNALVVAVEDTRPIPRAVATFSIWRSAMAITAQEGMLVAREVHDYDESGKQVAAAAKVSPQDRFYNLGVGVAAAFVGESALLPATGETDGDKASHAATIRTTTPRKYWLVITCATSYDGKPEILAKSALAALAGADKASLRARQLAWWSELWKASYIDLYGKDADTLTRLWYTSLYSYASVADGPVPPKFNGGPGLVHEDDRTWWLKYFWQNTRQLIWPMFAANQLRYARDYLDFYDRTFMSWKAETAKNGRVGIRMKEFVEPVKFGTVPPPRAVSGFDPAALEKAIADRRMEMSAVGHTAQCYYQAGELLQIMFDYVAFSGDSAFLRSVVTPWLKESSLFYLSFLKLGEDGRYHMMPCDALETWRNARDPMTEICAVRYCFWKVLNYGAEFGYEPEFIAMVRDRLGKLAPLPTGRMKLRPAKKEELYPGVNPKIKHAGTLEPTDASYAPVAEFLGDRLRHNAENPDLYAIYPFAMIDATSPAADRDRAVNTFRVRLFPNSWGWSACGIQAARLRLPATVDVIMEHVRRFQTYPYGGWDNAANRLVGSKLRVSDVPYFDSAGVQMTALQETLLQSHVLTTPDKNDPTSGGPIVLLPAVRKDWAGRFKLRARGGFLVTVEFQPGRRVERVVIESERGQTLTLANPYSQCRVLKGGQELLSSKEAVIRMPTKKGDVLEFLGSQARNP